MFMLNAAGAILPGAPFVVFDVEREAARHKTGLPESNVEEHDRSANMRVV